MSVYVYKASLGQALLGDKINICLVKFVREGGEGHWQK